AFRPTPSGLWAGVGVGRLGPRTRIDTGQPAPHLQIAWSRLATMAQALLERAEVRAAVRLRRAPSLVIGARTLLWLSATDGAEEGETGFVTEQAAERDEQLDAVLAASRAWTAWGDVRAAVLDAGAGSEDTDPAADMSLAGDEGGALDDVDEWLLTLLDAGLLRCDLVPP